MPNLRAFEDSTFSGKTNIIVNFTNGSDGNRGGLGIWFARQDVTLSGGSTTTTTVSIPSGNLILGAQFNVDTAITYDGGGATWKAIMITGVASGETNSGQAVIANGTTSIAVNHGLGRTPTSSEISVVPIVNPVADIGTIWVDTVTSTQFTINVESDPGGNTTFGWHITGNDVTTTLASGEAATKNTKVNTLLVPTLTTGTTQIRFIPDAGTFTAGAVRVVVYYMRLMDLGDEGADPLTILP